MKPPSGPKKQTQFKANFKRMNVNFCTKGYYKSKLKALKKPPLLEVNSESLRKDWWYVRFFWAALHANRCSSSRSVRRSDLPQCCSWKTPLVATIAAFGLDTLVQTDLEKINSVISTVIKAVEEEDCNAIEAIIAENYRDSYHNTKRHLLTHCRRRLTPSLIEKNKKTASLVELSPPNATATLFMLTTFDKNSSISVNYKSFLFSKIEFRLQKQHDKTWLINRVEILELDRQPAKWNDIR